MSTYKESPRDGSGGLQKVPDQDQTTRLSPCEHLDRAAYWLGVAERNWAEGTIYATAAKLAELHIMMADRAEFRGSCDE